MARSSAGGTRLILLSRAYCHLCDDMRAALAPLAARHDVAVTEIDVDTDAALEAAFGDLVPVLFADTTAAGNELSRYALDAPRVRAALAAK